MLLQVLTFFVAIAAKNFPLFVSMIFSLIVTLTIIGVTIWKRRSASLAESASG